MKKLLTGFLFLFAFAAAGQGRLRHVVVPVKDIAGSIPFYANVLGLRAVAVPGSLAASQAWFDAGGGQQIRLIEGKTDVRGVQLALAVGSLRQTEQQLRQRGVTVARQNSPTGRPALYLTDPDGYAIELAEAKAEGPGFLQSAAKSIWRSMTEVE